MEREIALMRNGATPAPSEAVVALNDERLQAENPMAWRRHAQPVGVDTKGQPFTNSSFALTSSPQGALPSSSIDTMESLLVDPHQA